jgi:hypothetical protein
MRNRAECRGTAGDGPVNRRDTRTAGISVAAGALLGLALTTSVACTSSDSSGVVGSNEGSGSAASRFSGGATSSSGGSSATGGAANANGGSDGAAASVAGGSMSSSGGSPAAGGMAQSGGVSTVGPGGAMASAGGGGATSLDSGLDSAGAPSGCPPPGTVGPGSSCSSGRNCKQGDVVSCDCVNGYFQCTYSICPVGFGGQGCSGDVVLPPGCFCQTRVVQPQNIFCMCTQSDA